MVYVYEILNVYTDWVERPFLLRTAGRQFTETEHLLFSRTNHFNASLAGHFNSFNEYVQQKWQSFVQLENTRNIPIFSDDIDLAHIVVFVY